LREGRGGSQGGAPGGRPPRSRHRPGTPRKQNPGAGFRRASGSVSGPEITQVSGSVSAPTSPGSISVPTSISREETSIRLPARMASSYSVASHQPADPRARSRPSCPSRSRCTSRPPAHPRVPLGLSPAGPVTSVLADPSASLFCRRHLGRRCSGPGGPQPCERQALTMQWCLLEIA
jgi:hypothetical protein